MNIDTQSFVNELETAQTDHFQAGPFRIFEEFFPRLSLVAFTENRQAVLLYNIQTHAGLTFFYFKQLGQLQQQFFIAYLTTTGKVCI